MVVKVPDYTYEQEALDLGFNRIVGVDEVGRGCVSSSVVAAAVNIPIDKVLHFKGQLKDSKKVSPKRREELTFDIISYCDVGVGIISNEIIDEINILEATKLAMRKALIDLSFGYDYIFIDGNVVLKDIPETQCQIIKGDSKVMSIAAASIVAKVVRDNIVIGLDKLFPLYGWARNKGYLTKEHREAIQIYGPCEYHRKSFKGVREYFNDL